MGYRSNVGIVLSRTAEAKLQDEIGSCTGDIRQEVESLLDVAEYKQSDPKSGATGYYFTWMKWYEAYPDVGFIMQFLDSLDGEDYLFIRIGENDDDTEERGCFYDNPFCMSLVREIAFEPVVELRLSSEQPEQTHLPAANDA